MSEGSWEQRVTRLEAIEAIRQLKALYCRHCDRGYDPDALAELFTEDAIWDGGPLRGVHRGRGAIRAFFAGVSGQVAFAAHLITNPLIAIDGDAATGHWRMLMLCSLVEGDETIATLQVAEYDEAYRRVGGEWLIDRLKVRLYRLAVPGAEWIDLATERANQRA